MTREEFIEALMLIVERGNITPEEQGELIAMFDAEQLAPSALWLPAAAATQIEYDNHINAALVAGLMVGIDPGDQIDAIENMAGNRIDAIAGMAGAEWHDEMRTLIIRVMIAAAIAGAGPEYSVIAVRETEEAAQDQLRWLYLFAVAAAARAALGRPWTDAYIAARSRQYLGEARALYYRALEQRQDFSDGYVIDYIAMDDPSTCRPCSAAARNGPYLPGRGPMPGDVCEGGGFCRCRRVSRFDPATAAELAAGS